ncbi:DUF1493 family protein [Burkholderia guangdongensis]|uniref:DUF1493 family protein n=1 Tax=Burkholderia guangdongensis TaxID=1792500 RepID=UPI0015CB2894|nr:DUF1493 family protein [Burkholderia guangdongensis]
MENVSWDAVTAFVRTEVGLGPSKPLTHNTRLREDLGQTGDEANDLMGHFFERFEVDPGDFDFHRYFLMEGEGLLYSLFQRWVMRKPHTFQREPITLAMLYQAARTKRWDSRAMPKGDI